MTPTNSSSLPINNLIVPYLKFSNNLKQEITNQLQFMYRAAENLTLVTPDMLEGILSFHYQNSEEISEYKGFVNDISQKSLDSRQQKDLSHLRGNLEEIFNANKRIIELSQSCLEKIKSEGGDE